MKPTERIAQIRRERALASAKTLLLREIRECGSARAEALRAADDALDRLARRLPEAVGAGLSMSELARAAGVSRQTLYELRGRYGGAADVRLAVLYLATGLPTSSIAKSVGRSEAEVNGILDDFERDGWIEDPGNVFMRDDGGEETEIAVWHITEAGIAALEAWSFEVDTDDGAL